MRHEKRVTDDDRRYDVEPGTPAPGPMRIQVALAALVLLIVLSLLVTQVASCAAPRSGPIPDVQRPETLALHLAGTDRGGRAVTLAQLARLRTVDTRPNTPGYRRSNFGPGLTEVGSDAAPGPWQGNGCRTLDDVRAQQLTSLVTVKKGRCARVPTSGVLADPYQGGKRIVWTSRRASAVQADHVLALDYLWDLGANRWPASKRAAAANDPANLVLTEGRVNASKGSRGPSEWVPSSKPGACFLASRQVQVAAKYGVAIPRADKAALAVTIKGACS